MSAALRSKAVRRHHAPERLVSPAVWVIKAFLQVEDLQKQSLLKPHDAVVPYRPAGRESPKLKQLLSRGLSART